MGLISRVSSRTYRRGEQSKMQRLGRTIAQRALSTSANRAAFPANGGLTHEQRVKAWCDYFDHDECDYWYFRHATRTMELVKMRCRNNRAAYNWLMQELQPTFDDLGMKTPEELGFYDNVEELNTA